MDTNTPVDTTDEFKIVVNNIIEIINYLTAPICYEPETVLLQAEELRQELKGADLTYQAVVTHTSKYLLPTITILFKILTNHLNYHQSHTTTALHIIPDEISGETSYIIFAAYGWISSTTTSIVLKPTHGKLQVCHRHLESDTHFSATAAAHRDSTSGLHTRHMRILLLIPQDLYSHPHIILGIFNRSTQPHNP